MARVNRKWASGIGEDGQPVYAPFGVITVNGRKVYNPTDKHYALAKFKPVVSDPPSVPPAEGWHYEPRGWEDTDGAIRRVYVEVQDPPPPPKVYSTADAIEALMKEEVWELCRAWIEEQGLLDLVLVTKEFSSDLENFDTVIGGLQRLLGWSDEKVAEILAEAEVG